MPYRRWTRLGIVAVASHLGYELAVGVGVPGAPRIGVRPAVAGYALATAGAYRTAGRLPGPRGDRRFAAANGLFASAVSRTMRAGRGRRPGTDFPGWWSARESREPC